MTLASDLVLITTDPATGRSLLGSNETDPVLGGVLLVDLVLAERVEVEGPPKRARVRLVSTRPLDSPPHDTALGRLEPGRHPKASTLVPKVGRGARALLLEQLVAQEALAPRRERVLGVFPTTRYDVVDTARRERLAAALDAVLSGRVPPDDVTGPLIGLLQAGGVVKRLVPPTERRAAVRKAKDIARGDWAGSAAKAALIAAASAVSVAASDASSADGGGSGGDGC